VDKHINNMSDVEARYLTIAEYTTPDPSIHVIIIPEQQGKKWYNPKLLTGDWKVVEISLDQSIDINESMALCSYKFND
jgi:hypothetical protein